MRLYIDNQYPPVLARILSELHQQQTIPEFEIVYRDWLDNYSSDDTIVFLVSFQKKGPDLRAVQHFKDGYRVFSLKKPYGQPFSTYLQSLMIMNLWRDILEIIKSETKPFIYTISGGKKLPLNKNRLYIKM